MSDNSTKERIFSNIESYLQNTEAKHFAVNKKTEFGFFEISTDSGFYSGTIYFSPNDDAVCMDLKLPTVIPTHFHLAAEHYIARQTASWVKDSIRLDKNNAVVFHGCIDISNMEEQILNLNNIINTLPLSSEEKEEITKKTTECLLPSAADFKQLEKSLMLKVLWFEDSFYKIAAGIPLDERDTIDLDNLPLGSPFGVGDLTRRGGRFPRINMDDCDEEEDAEVNLTGSELLDLLDLSQENEPPVTA